MQKVIHIEEIQNYSGYIEKGVIEYINDGQIETYESFDNFDFIAFDWYDINDTDKDPSQILIYIDDDDLFYICENEEAYKTASSLFAEDKTNEHALYLFFRNLFKGSTKHLEQLEEKVASIDDRAAAGEYENIGEDLVDMRNEVLRLKKYYEQLEFLFEEICDNDNSLISSDCMRYFEILHNRTMRLVSQVLNLREYVNQVRESYQSKIEIEQNDLMKVFTFVTSIFLPLTLIAGWYGMNLQMPEYGWRFGYIFVIVLCLLVGILWFIVFKKKKWF